MFASSLRTASLRGRGTTRTSCKLSRRHVLWLGMGVLVLLGTAEFALLKSHYNNKTKSIDNQGGTATVATVSSQQQFASTAKTDDNHPPPPTQQRLGQGDATKPKPFAVQQSNIQQRPVAATSTDPSLKRLAIVLPFRESSTDTRSPGVDRESNLRAWLNHMSDFMKPQLLPVTTIYIIEQRRDSGSFNKGWLCNAGFDFVMKDHAAHNKNTNGGVDYFIFHDVDQVPRKGPKGCENCYDYRSSPTKLIRETTRKEDGKNKDVVRKLSPTNVGGALMITPDVFRKVNGYSNILPGWGLEDENMAYRIKRFNGGFRVLTPGKFRGLPHARLPGLDTTEQFKKNAENSKDVESGLSNLHYEVFDETRGQMKNLSVVRVVVKP